MAEATFDVIIIGAGIAGLVTANRAAQLGKRVVVLEKSTEDKYICNSRYAYGTIHINYSDLNQDEDVLVGRIEAATEGTARKDLARAVAKDGRRLVQWLKSEGINVVAARRLPDRRAVAGLAQGLRPDLEGLRQRPRVAAARRQLREAPGPHPARHPGPRR